MVSIAACLAWLHSRYSSYSDLVLIVVRGHIVSELPLICLFVGEFSRHGQETLDFARMKYIRSKRWLDMP